MSSIDSCSVLDREGDWGMRGWERGRERGGGWKRGGQGGCLEMSTISAIVRQFKVPSKCTGTETCLQGSKGSYCKDPISTRQSRALPPATRNT